MRPLTAAAILRAWERGQAGGPFEWALHLLVVADPGDRWDAFGRLPVGERDARLLALREASLGTTMRAYVLCPACGAELTFDLDTTDLATTASPPERADAIHEVTVGGLTARFRLPSSFDAAGLPASADVATLRHRLALRCLVALSRDQVPVDGESVPDELVDAISEAMSRLDPAADTTIKLACPECEHRWDAPFDIAAFFWEETAGLARRLLREVDSLAHSYAWREADILAMTAWRREAYLQLVQG